jgi:mediator of RNA polymerase II transcription subunit 31
LHYLSGLLLRPDRVSIGMEGNGVNNSTSPVSSDPKAANRARFELELEFVQALANPFYLHSLAQQNILEQPAFVNFLRYLLYFKEKDYARFIQYAHMLPLHVTIQYLT